MLTANIGALEYLPDTGDPFSIREWIADDNRGGFLFLTSRGDQHASLRGLISTWLEIAVNAMLSLEQDDERRIWVVLDELPTLHQVPSLQGRTVDNVIAAMEATHPHLTTQKSFYVESSRERDRAELVTDDAKALREQLEAVTGERISALERIGEMLREEEGKAAETRL